MNFKITLEKRMESAAMEYYVNNKSKIKLSSRICVRIYGKSETKIFEIKEIINKPKNNG